MSYPEDLDWPIRAQREIARTPVRAIQSTHLTLLRPSRFLQYSLALKPPRMPLAPDGFYELLFGPLIRFEVFKLLMFIFGRQELDQPLSLGLVMNAFS